MRPAGQQLDGAFTVDVEDYFHVSAFASVIRPDDWDQYESRVETNTRRVLELAAEAGTSGTFFVLGWVAERFPELICEIQSAGHEIGCHSHRHQIVYELEPEQFREDIIRSRDLLQQMCGRPVTMFRAPSFSITVDSFWALDILAEEGFTLDSSIYPIHHDRYGIADAPLIPHRLQLPCGTMTEFPGMVCRIGGMNLPVGGGGYLRLMPWWATHWLLRHVVKHGQPLNVYIHPWELDPDQPRIAAPLKSRFRHYQNLRTTSRKVRNLLHTFALGKMSDAVSAFLPSDIVRSGNSGRPLTQEVC